MVVELGLAQNSHDCAVTALDLGLLTNSEQLPSLLKLYLYSCQVEGKATGTLDGYSRRIQSFIDFLQSAQLPLESSKIQPNHVKLYFYSLYERKLEPSTINVHYRALKTFLLWLKGEGYVTANLMERQKPPSIPRKVVKPFSMGDIKNMLTICSGNGFLDIRNRAIILLLLDTGLRLSELANIQLADINLQKETIRVMGKGSKERYVRAGRDAQKALYKYLLQRKDSYPCLWLTEERTPLAKGSIQTFIKRICKEAGVKGCRPGPHTFRHTFATRALMNGAGEFEVQSLLGHSTLVMTRRYTSGSVPSSGVNS
ncbi:tyrosine-type recombinase/integrase [Dehalogenimonas sp. THU2]|uniref:tyrosine-type recombinase/integrase n=1 Tax=Dehalogenimonas sp. THU2 TaxID=3151121 RepID=UPI00321811A1